MLLKKELAQLESYIENLHKSNNKVSAKPIAWHLDHSLKVIIGVCETVQKSDPSKYIWKFNILRTIVFIVGYFPRGKAKAPKQVLPPESISKDDLQNQLALARRKVSNLGVLSAHSYFKHPYFGHLNLKQTQKFLRLHTTHHLKICDDIIN